MSLLDEFLTDLETMDTEEETSDHLSSLLKNEAMVTNDIFEKTDSLSKFNISSVAKLKNSLVFEEIMQKIGFYSTHQRKSTTEIQGPVENDPEYSLIIDANNLVVEINNEIDIIHSFVKNIYQKTISELEQIVRLPLDYLKTVQVRFFHILKYRIIHSDYYF